MKHPEKEMKFQKTLNSKSNQLNNDIQDISDLKLKEENLKLKDENLLLSKNIKELKESLKELQEDFNFIEDSFESTLEALNEMKTKEKNEEILPKKQEIGIILKTLFSECEICQNSLPLKEFFEKYNNLLKEETKKNDFLKYIVKASSQALLVFEKENGKEKTN